MSMKNQSLYSRSPNNIKKNQIPFIPQQKTTIKKDLKKILQKLKHVKTKSKSNSPSSRKDNHQSTTHKERSFSTSVNLTSDTEDEETVAEGDSSYTNYNQSSSNIISLINNAKDLIQTQSSILNKCSQIRRVIKHTDHELDSLYTQTIFNNEEFSNNLLQYKAKTNEQIQRLMQYDSSFKSFIINELNSVNELVGNLGYNYLYHKFKEHNFINENISEYFQNSKKLITNFHYKIKRSDEIIEQQQRNIEQYKHDLIILQEELTECNNNLFSSRKRSNVNNSNIFSYREKNAYTTNDIKFQTDKNCYESNIELSSSSNLFESKYFFDEYKRNKDIRNDTDLDHSYTNVSSSGNQSQGKINEENSIAEFDYFN